MQTYSGNTALSPPSEEIVHHRKGGWFLTYKKVLSFIVLIMVAVIVAGLIGWNIGTMPKTRSYDPLALIEDETEEGDIIIASISPFVHPLRYSLELTPPSLDMNATAKFKGRVVVEFRIDGTPSLNKLSLNAWNVTATRYKLLFVDESRHAPARRRRRRRAEDDDNAGTATPLNRTVTSSSQLEKQGGTQEDVTGHPLGNVTSSGNETASQNETLSLPDERAVESANATTSEPPSNTVTFANGNRTATEVEIQRYEVDVNNGLHVIHPAVAMSSGRYSLEIDYEIQPDGKTIYSASFGEEKPDDWAIDTFEDTPLLSPYNLAFVVGQVESLDETKAGPDNATVTFWGDLKRHSRGMYLVDKLYHVVEHLNGVFSMPYPLAKLDIVALPSRIVDNAGNLGLISMRQSLFYLTHRSPMVMKTDALSALISLIGEQWLGGVVNTKNWTDVWLLEGSTLHLRHTMIEKAHHRNSVCDICCNLESAHLKSPLGQISAIFARSIARYVENIERKTLLYRLIVFP
ncbi:Leucyl-cystinyl aminopeptidase [Harpegnathos saltator]|uniref:Leucyl-cystinyl aminopeptidase n=1 Tax=Harpegnathos saltator TaxID=610380 RepID=E2C7E8_HARSA|nr:Leucyl-cystinyl aminopeptidase [Harpegnathos saltator]